MTLRASKHTPIKNEDLNLIPVMNLVSILIPFALMSAQFVNLAIIDSSMPVIGMAVPQEGVPDRVPLTLSVQMTAAGFTLSGGEAPLPAFEGANIGPNSDQNKPTFSVLPAREILGLCQQKQIDQMYVDMSTCFGNHQGDPCALRLDRKGQPICNKNELDSRTEYPWHLLGTYVEKIREEYPCVMADCSGPNDHNEVILMPNPDTPYGNIVAMMDATRERLGARPDKSDLILFPNVVMAGGVTQ